MKLARIDVRIGNGTYCMHWYVLVRMACICMYSKVQVLVGIGMYLYVQHVLVCMVCMVCTGMYMYVSVCMVSIGMYGMYYTNRYVMICI